MSNVVSLVAARQIKDKEADEHAYQARILSMDKLELLEEMVRFQEERSRVGHLTLTMILRGRYLFSALEKASETNELRLLAKSYRRHLEFELIAYRNDPAGLRTNVDPFGNDDADEAGSQ
jgi:hypothetical protein